MKAFENLTVKNSLIYAMKCYDNPQCLDEEEFIEDYKRLKYVKRLCRRYLATGRVSERLMLNHLVLLNNVFTVPAATRLLFLKCNDARMYRVLKTFMRYMGTLPDVVTGIDGEDIYTAGIPNDEKLFAKLQAL
jgi:hypothetical protein